MTVVLWVAGCWLGVNVAFGGWLWLRAVRKEGE